MREYSKLFRGTLPLGFILWRHGSLPERKSMNEEPLELTEERLCEVDEWGNKVLSKRTYYYVMIPARSAGEALESPEGPSFDRLYEGKFGAYYLAQLDVTPIDGDSYLGRCLFLPLR